MPDRTAAELDLLLDGYLDDLLANVPPAAHLEQAAPDLARTAQLVVALDYAPGADAVFASNGWKALVQSRATTPMAATHVLPAIADDLGPTAPEQSAMLPARASRHAWFATAILVVLTALSGFVAFIGARPATMSPASLWTIEGLSGEIALDPLSGNVWLVSGPDGFTILSAEGDKLDHWGSPGRDDGEFQLAPWGLERPLGGAAFDREGNLYVVDTGNSRVQKFGPDRAFLTAWGSPGSGDGRFEVPGAIAISEDGLIYVADQRRQDVQIFSTGGKFLGVLGTEEQFKAPVGLAVDEVGNIWVSDQVLNQVQKLTPEGKVLAVTTPRNTDNRLRRPVGLAIDPDGRLFVADPAKNEIEMFDEMGNSLAAWNGKDVSVFPFEGLNALATDNDGNLYVSDRGTLRKVRIPPP